MMRKLAARAVMSLGILVAGQILSSELKADEWGRYYHWPYDPAQQYQWSPYEYERTYDGGYRYPKEMRVYQTQAGSRNWLTVRKPYYRGYHFILDRF